VTKRIRAAMRPMTWTGNVFAEGDVDRGICRSVTVFLFK
jgi:hypothetical protein